MLCLANSKKNNERCLAGLRLDTGGWIRPVSDADGSALIRCQYTTGESHVPEPLDTVRIQVTQQRPKYNQPENWIIAKENWELITTELNNKQLLAINTALQRSGSILFNSKSSLTKNELREYQIANSLTLICPESPEFYVEIKDGKGKPYAEFSFDDNKYDLPITDPRWCEQAETNETLPSADTIEDEETVLFTLSLGESFNGRCYKLVAAIFTVESDRLINI